jgi:hypothetical protein
MPAPIEINKDKNKRATLKVTATEASSDRSATTTTYAPVLIVARCLRSSA